VSIVFLGLIVALPSCTSTVTVRPVPTCASYAWVQRPLPASDEPSPGTLHFLRFHGLDRVWRGRPGAALKAAEDAHETSTTARFATVELSLIVARRLPAPRVGDRLDLHVDAAGLACAYLFDARLGGPDPGFDRNYASAVMMYADAVARVVETLAASGAACEAGTTIVVGGPAEPFALTIGCGDRQFDQFRTLVAVDRFAVKGLPERFMRCGLGALFAGLVGRETRRPESAFYPLKGLGAPVTALVRFAPASPDGGGVPRRADLVLLDPRTQETVEIGNHAVPVAADFTASYGYLAAMGERDIRTIGSKGMFSPSSTGSFHRMILMERYDPNKTLLVLVHGLWSDPSIWLPLTDRIEGDSELRRTYQI